MVALKQQQVCRDFADLVNGLRSLKHEAGSKKRAVDPLFAELLTAHQVELQALETRAKDLWVLLGPLLAAETVVEARTLQEVREQVRHVPAFPERELEPPPAEFVLGMTDD